MAVGVLGKLPAHGDFVQRNLPGRLAQFWYDWLEAIMITLRQEWGVRWSGQHESTPTWHFFLASGLLDVDAWAGIVVPSSDRVGRAFPLVISRAIPALQPSDTVLAQSFAWGQEAQKITLRAIDDHHRVQALLDALTGLGDPVPGGASDPPSLDALHQARRFSLWRREMSPWLRVQELPSVQDAAALVARYQLKRR